MNLTELQGELRGRLIAAEDGEYEALRQRMLFNQLQPAQRPAAIVQAAGDGDVVATLRFARRSGLRVAIRGGGHNWCGTPLRDGTLLLDLARLNEISVDAAAGTASVQPAATGRELHRQLAPHELAFPYGHCSTVGLGGFLLSGGLGWNSGAWGLGCLNLRGADVVTADGELRQVSASQHPELFWALRGAGPTFFGVVTRFHLALQPLPLAMQTSTCVYPLERLGELAAWLPELAGTLSRDVELTLLAGSGGRIVPRAGRVCVLTATAFVDDENDAADALAPLDRAPISGETVMVERTRPTSFDTLFDEMDGYLPSRHRYVADTLWSNHPPRSVLAGATALMARAPSPKSMLLCVAPPPDDAALPDIAFSMSGSFFVACYAVWDDAARDDANRAWHREAMAQLEPFAAGHYIAESDIVATPSRIAGSFSPANWQRLQSLRAQYDPDHLFALPGLGNSVA